MSIQACSRAPTSAEWINKHCCFIFMFRANVCPLCVFPGMPPATGTGTLIIHLEDYNDNAPYVVPSVARVCEDAHDMNVAIVGGRDKDLTPNAAPFKIELGKQPGLDKTWKVTRVNCEYWVLNGDVTRWCSLKRNAAFNPAIILLYMRQKCLPASCRHQLWLTTVCVCHFFFLLLCPRHISLHRRLLSPFSLGSQRAPRGMSE